MSDSGSIKQRRLERENKNENHEAYDNLHGNRAMFEQAEILTS